MISDGCFTATVPSSAKAFAGACGWLARGWVCGWVGGWVGGPVVRTCMQRRQETQCQAESRDALVGVGVVVDDVHFVALCKHARVGRPNAARPYDAHCLILRRQGEAWGSCALEPVSRVTLQQGAWQTCLAVIAHSSDRA